MYRLVYALAVDIAGDEVTGVVIFGNDVFVVIEIILGYAAYGL